MMMYEPFDNRITNAAVFNVLRTLKAANKGDTYYESYLGHYQNWGEEFIDYYHYLWYLGAVMKPKKMLEVGCRTGISICQLLSSMMDYKDKRVVLFDIFADGFTSPELVKMNLKYLNIPVEPEFIIGDSTETIPRFIKNNPGELFDYVLVDGNHDKEYARNDLRNCQALVAPGGVIVFDDISDAPGECGLIDVWREFTNGYKDSFNFTDSMVGKGFGLGVRK